MATKRESLRNSWLTCPAVGPDGKAAGLDGPKSAEWLEGYEAGVEHLAKTIKEAVPQLVPGVDTYPLEAFIDDIQKKWRDTAREVWAEYNELVKKGAR